MTPRAVLFACAVLGAVFAAPVYAQSGPVVGCRPEGIAFSITSGTAPETATRGIPFSVPLSVVNTGTRPWKPGEDIHFSYRWRNFFGDDLRYESERTAFATVVPPGAQTRVNARVEPPGVPGVYILEWALVWEHRGWIPRDSAKPRIVTVLPTGYDLATAAVFVLALVSLVRFRRANPAGWWVAGALLTRPLVLVADRDLSVTATAVLVTAALTAGVLATGHLVPRRFRLLAGWLVVATATMIVLIDVAHARFFGDVPSVGSIGGVARALELAPSALAVLTGWPLLLILELLLALPAAIHSLRPAPTDETAAGATWLSGRPLPTTTSAAAVVVAALVVVVLASQATAYSQIFKNVYAVQQLGAYGYHVRDISAAWLVEKSDTAPPVLVDKVNRWMHRTREYTQVPGEAFGRAANRSVIVVQAESLQSFVVGLTVGGHEITPTLNRLRRDALWFPHIYDQTSEGRTSDAEFAALTSSLPAKHGATVFAHATNNPVALPQILRRLGVPTLAAVPFDASFWNRSTAWPAYGFGQTLFDMDFEPGASVGWGLNDGDFLNQMARRLSIAQEPFLAWLVTLSLHHPFESFPEEMRSLDLGEWNRTPLGNYLEAMHLFDVSLGVFLKRLQADGVLDKTMVVVIGDHDANLPRDGRVAAALGLENRAESWEAADRVPLFILGAEGLTGEVGVVGGQIDLTPTVLALLGIDPGSLPFFGRDLLNDPENRPVVRPYGGWVDAEHLFVPSATGSAGSSGRCFARETMLQVPLTNCANGLAAAAEQRRLADAVITFDLQSRLQPPTQRVFVKPPRPQSPAPGAAKTRNRRRG